MIKHELADDVPKQARVVEVVVSVSPPAGEILVHRTRDDEEPLRLGHGVSVRFGLGDEQCVYVTMLSPTEAYSLRVTDWAE